VYGFGEIGFSEMRTNVEIDDTLIANALRLTRLPTKRAAIERGLELLVEKHSRLLAIAETSGIGWDGDLDHIRDAERGPKIVAP
jgi:Arc/MetJ family transcription regulator